MQKNQSAYSHPPPAESCRCNARAYMKKAATGYAGAASLNLKSLAIKRYALRQTCPCGRGRENVPHRR